MQEHTNLKTPPPSHTSAHTYPLAGFQGALPPAPSWFSDQLEIHPKQGQVSIADACLSYQTWGETGKQGLLFLHGGQACRQWWDFLAPSFTNHFTPAAFCLSGMGDSQWRPAYDLDIYAEEALGVMEHLNFFDHQHKPLIVGHSFGGYVALKAALSYGERLGGVVVLDSPLRSSRNTQDPVRKRSLKVYHSLTDALARFRLLPPQSCENFFLLDYIARSSLRRVRRLDDSVGWVWKFDPDLWSKFSYALDPPEDIATALPCPTAFLRGARSALMTEEIWEVMEASLHANGPFITLPEARHHVMLDQPLALIGALRTLFSVWPQKA